MKKQVVIIGAGFAGVNVAHALRHVDVDITIVDRNNFHTFQPFLYQVATGYLAPEEVGSTIRSIFRTQDNVHTVVGQVESVDWNVRELHLSEGETVHFDYLVVAAGGTANLSMISGMEEHSQPLYTMNDAVTLRKRLIADLEETALREQSPSDTTVVVVGGGPTGVETAGALASMAKDLLGRHVNALHVVLVEAVPNLLTGFGDKGAEAALEGLKRRGVEVRLNTKVKQADSKGIEFEDGSQISTQLIVWAAGIKAQDLGDKLGLATNKRKGIIVDSSLKVASHPDVFAAGDIAAIEGNPLPQVAPAAIQMGKHVARQIKRELAGKPVRDFRYINKGNMAVIGRGAAVTKLPGGPSFAGRLAWLFWLGLHIVYLIGFRNKLKVLVDWGWNYFTARGSNAILLKDHPQEAAAKGQ